MEAEQAKGRENQDEEDPEKGGWGESVEECGGVGGVVGAEEVGGEDGDGSWRGVQVIEEGEVRGREGNDSGAVEGEEVRIGGEADEKGFVRGRRGGEWSLSFSLSG